MRNRKGFDWSKPFKFVATKKQFDQIDNNQDTFIVIPTDQPKPLAPHKKEEIPVPKIQTVKRVTEVKKFAKITPNYIRLPAHLNLPSAHNYELTQVDHAFVKTHQDRFYFKGKKVLTLQFLKKSITQLELKAGKDMTLPRSKGWMTAFLQKEYKQLLQMDQADQLSETVYNYWKNRREELKFPLLRLLWKPSPEEYHNHMLAFRPRERQKRSLRRTNRVVEDEIIQQLYEQFDLASKIVDRIQMREELKFKQVSMQVSSFYSQCKSFFPVPDFMQEAKMQERSKDKQRMRGFHASLQNYKNRKLDIENMVIQEPGDNQVDTKQSIVNFLATVVYQVEQKKLSYEHFFTAISTPGPEIKPIDPKTRVNPQQPVLIKQPEQTKNVQEYVHFSMQRFQDMLIRTFDEDESVTEHVKPCKDYLQLKRRRVDGYYFGSDDEGEIKDTKKNVAASFKRYLQMQHATRTISATSQN